MLKYVCDRCGKDIPRMGTAASITLNTTETRIDLCEDCHISLLKEICRTDGIMSKGLKEYCLIFLGPHYDGQINIDEILKEE